MLYSHVESQEMYLKAISKLIRCKTYVRAIDVSEETGYAKSSVSRALSILERDGYIKRDENSSIELTCKGKNEVDFLEDRFLILKNMLIEHGLNNEEAESTACEIEHYVSRDIYEKLKNHLTNK